MKQKLLIVSAAMLVAGSAFAERTKPVLTPMDAPVANSLTSAKAFYLYNVQKDGFALGANDWTTRLSVGAKGDSLKLVSFKLTAESTLDSLGFYDYGVNKAYWSPDSWDGIWNDGSRTGYNMWVLTLKDAATKTYIISNTKLGEGTLGYYSNDSLASPKLYVDKGDTLAAGLSLYDQWQFISVADYQTIEAYNESLVLGKAIADAKAEFPSLDVTAEQAVCDDATASTADVKKAEDSLNEKLLAAKAAAVVESATVSAPADMTSFITNPSFEDGNYNGWTVTTSSDTGAKANSNSTYHCDNADGDYLFNIWSWGYPITQEVKNLPSGIYQMSAMVSSSDDCTNIYILAGDSHKAVTLETNPSNTTSKQTWMTTGSMIVRVDSTLKIGAVGCSADGVTYTANGKWWYKVDNFQLKYYGTKDESYVYWRDNGDDMISLYDNSTLMTTSVRESYDALTGEFKAATTKDAILAAYDKIVAYDSVVAANVAAWKAYSDAIESAKGVAADKTILGDDRDKLADYLEFDAAEKLEQLALTDEELAAEVILVDSLKNLAIVNGVSDGSDMTKYLTNPKFDDGTAGWNGSPTINKLCAEKYGCAAFDVWQQIENAPVGMYEITMQGFYRQLRDDNASKDATADPTGVAGEAWSLFFDADGNRKTPAPDTLAYVYLNSNKTPLKCLYEEQIKVGEIMTSGDARIDPMGQYWYANDMETAALAFADKDSTGKARYAVSAYGLVAKKGDAMRIGVKGNLLSGANWAIFDNFTLTYRAYNAELIKSEFDAAVAGYSVPASAMGDSVRTAALALTDSIQKVDITDGKAMFNLLSQVYEMKETMETSIALFQTLTDRVAEFNNEISEYSTTASTEAVAEAMELYSKYSNLATAGLNNGDVAGAIAAIDAAAQKLLIPGDYDKATDDSPVEFTSMIKSYNFEDKDGNNSIAGWTYTSTPGGITSGQTAAKAAEYYQSTYNIYQDVNNLPAGTYQLAVNACYRYGSTSQDFDSINVPTLAVMYAVTSTDSIAMPVCHMSQFAQTEKVGSGSEASNEDKDGMISYIPNDMLSAVAYFSIGCYNNKLIVKVPEDGKLRIGMTQKESVTYGWMLMDDWSLTYYGTKSVKEQGGITSIESLNENAPKAVEYYSISGVKMSGLRQGINIVRRADAKGNMKTVKVIVR